MKQLAIVLILFIIPLNMFTQNYRAIWVNELTKMAEPYICTGSLYLTALGFLSLGLPENHSFWTSKSEPWTMVKIWRGDASVKRDTYKN